MICVHESFAFGEPGQAVEVTEEFISTVDEVDDHCGSMWISTEVVNFTLHKIDISVNLRARKAHSCV